MVVVVVRARGIGWASLVPPPARLCKTVGIVNVEKRGDEKCFLWSVLTGIHPITSNPHHLNHYVT